jgi:hypothetical protein
MNSPRTHVLNFIAVGLCVLGLLFASAPELYVAAGCLLVGSITMSLIALVLFARDIRRLDREPVWTGRRR